jgi:zinc transport system substrate-binding protein
VRLRRACRRILHRTCFQTSTIVLGLLLAACHPPAPAAEAGRLRVAVSVPPQAYFVERIGGRRVEVDVMIPPGYSHVDYSLTPRQVVALSRARLYVAVGHPAFEIERTRIVPLLADLPEVEVVDMSRGMRLLDGEGEGSERAGGHGHAGGDPHVWVAPETVAVAARNIAAALERTDPHHAAEYRSNLPRFEADIAALDREIRSRLASSRGGAFLVYHPTWGYFAREYGLRQVAIEAEGKEPSAVRLIQLIDEAKRENVKVVFVQGGFPRKSAQVIADAVGARLVVADPQERDWLGNLRRVTREVEAALGPDGVDRAGVPAEASPPVPLSLTGEGERLRRVLPNPHRLPAKPVVHRPPSPIRERGTGGEASRATASESDRHA